MKALLDDNVYKTSLNDIYKTLESCETGLSSAKVRELIKSGSKNLLSKTPKKTFFSRVLVAISEPMVKVLIVAIFLTIIINLISIKQHQPPDWGQTIGITCSVLLATLVTVFMEMKSQDAFLSLKKIGDKRDIKVMRDGVICEIPIEQIFLGDIVFITAGDKVPADGRIIESNDLEIDEALLTGESQASKKIQGSSVKDAYSLGERTNMVYSGTFVISGHGKILVTAIGDNTEIGKISLSVQIDYNILTPLQKELGTLGKQIAIVGIGIAIIVFCLKIFNYYIDDQLNVKNIAEAITICIILIVSTIPEGLPTMVAATLALGAIRLSKENALVKKLAVCESIGAIDVICSDKTGTLTENKMDVIKIESQNENMILKNIFFNNSSSITKYGDTKMKFIGNPTEVALLNYYYKQKEKIDTTQDKLIFQYPFNSTKKTMGTIIFLPSSNEYIFFIKGAPEKIFEICKISSIEKSNFIQAIEAEQALGRRIIAFAHKILPKEENWKDYENNLSTDCIYDGFTSISDPIRKEVFTAINLCQKAGIDVKILTGDNTLTATTIAHELGLITPNSLILDAKTVDSMSDYELRGKLKNISVIGRSNPLTKLRVVNILMDMGKSVAVTGDGINDAPSLKRAEVGIAMGITGTEVSKETADIILLNDSFATIVKAIESGRGLYENFQKFIQFQQIVNVAALFLILMFELLDWGTPLKPIQILWINIMMDGPLAISLSFEKTRKYIMNELPRDKSKSIITIDLWINIFTSATFMVLSMIFFVRVFHITKEMTPTYIFNLFIFLVIFNVYNCKSIGKESVLKGFFNNQVLNTVFLIIIGIQILISLFLKNFFSLKPLPTTEYLKIILFSFLIIVFSEFIKFLKRIFSN